MQITSQLNPIVISQKESLHSSNDRIDALSPNSIPSLPGVYNQLDDIKLLTEVSTIIFQFHFQPAGIVGISFRNCFYFSAVCNPVRIQGVPEIKVSMKNLMLTY